MIEGEEKKSEGKFSSDKTAWRLAAASLRARAAAAETDDCLVMN